MMKRLHAFLMALILLQSGISAEELRLTKSLYGLDDFYYACTGTSFIVESSGVVTVQDSWHVTIARAELFRRSIQFEAVNDTVWVKVFITTKQGFSREAEAEFRKLNLRGVSKFGDIFAAKSPILSLPDLEALSYVERIEPVTPEGYTARASISSQAPLATTAPVKKK